MNVRLGMFEYCYSNLGAIYAKGAKGLCCECSHTKGTASLSPLGRLVVTLANKVNSCINKE